MKTMKITDLMTDTLVTNVIRGHSQEFADLLRSMEFDQEIKGTFVLSKRWKKGTILELSIKKSE